MSPSSVTKRPLAAPSGFLVIVAVMRAAQNPMTSSRMCSACSRPRRGSSRRSRYSRNRLTIATPSRLLAKRVGRHPWPGRGDVVTAFHRIGPRCLGRARQLDTVSYPHVDHGSCGDKWGKPKGSRSTGDGVVDAITGKSFAHCLGEISRDAARRKPRSPYGRCVDGLFSPQIQQRSPVADLTGPFGPVPLQVMTSRSRRVRTRWAMPPEMLATSARSATLHWRSGSSSRACAAMPALPVSRVGCSRPGP